MFSKLKPCAFLLRDSEAQGIKMPAVSSGRITKSRKGKHVTPLEHRHKWESFTSKVSKLHTLDPIRKVRRHDLEAETLSAETSYFRQGLQKWNELNLAKGFVSFKRAALPISDSLPQILHFEDDIMDALDKHISEHEKASLEPLLDLLAAFARDLGQRFEKYYGRSLNLIAGIVGKPQDVEVIEWAFSTLAFLFKYLSKLLVPDLRPTYDILAPLMGKSRHPQHIARFAAEAISFLVRKAAAPSTRDTALRKIISHVRADILSVVGDRQFTLYQDGVMTMFAEAAKGTGDTVHSTGPFLITALIEAIPREEFKLKSSPTWTGIICGVLTSVLHKSTPASATELLDAILDSAETKIDDEPSEGLSWEYFPWFQILGTVSGVRGGSKVTQWDAVVRLLVTMMERMARARLSHPEDQSDIIWRHVIFNIAVVWHAAPMPALMSKIGSFTQSMTRDPFMRFFIPFCSYFSSIDPKRFSSLIKNDFQK